MLYDMSLPIWYQCSTAPVDNGPVLVPRHGPVVEYAHSGRAHPGFQLAAHFVAEIGTALEELVASAVADIFFVVQEILKTSLYGW